MNIIGGTCRNNNIETLKKLYSKEPALRDMRDYTKKKLKIWETEVVSRFPV